MKTGIGQNGFAGRYTDIGGGKPGRQEAIFEILIGNYFFIK